MLNKYTSLSAESLLIYIYKLVQYLLRWPHFKIVETPKNNNKFILKSTRLLWIWSGIGMLLIGVPLIETKWIQVLAFVFATTWIYFLAKKIIKSKESSSAKRKKAVQNEVNQIYSSPLQKRLVRTIIWVPLASTVLIISAYRIFSFSFDKNINNSCQCIYDGSGFYNLILLYLVFFFIYVLIRLLQPGIPLPNFQSWYNDLPKVVRELVKESFDGKLKYPSMTWRSMVDLSQASLSFAMTEAFFGNKRNSGLFTLTSNWMLWYLAPILLPLISLLIAPMVADILFQFDYKKPSNLQFGLAIIIWGFWASAYFVFIGTRDFVDAPSWNTHGQRALVNTVFTPKKEVHRVATEYFAGKWTVVSNLALLVLIPAYLSYIALFSTESINGEKCLCNMYKELHIDDLNHVATENKLEGCDYFYINNNISGEIAVSVKGEMNLDGKYKNKNKYVKKQRKKSSDTKKSTCK